MSSPDQDANVTDRLLGGLLDASHGLAPWQVAHAAAEHARVIDGRDVIVLLQDYGQQWLMPLTGGDGQRREPEPIAGTAAGEAFTTVTPVELGAGGGVRLFLPLLDGADRLGVLALTLPAIDDRLRTLCTRFASVVTEMIVSKGMHSDVFFTTRRTRPMALAAEMQWGLLPPLTVITPRVALAGAMEPAYEVGGDAFDYAVNGDIAHLGVFDAMGHDLDAATMAAVVVGAYRHSRRNDTDLDRMYLRLDAVLSQQFGLDSFATVLLAELHLDAGELCWVNAGHPAPLLFRDNAFVRALDATPTLPVGLGGAAPVVTADRLLPGDRIVFYSDGVVEERQAGVQFGEDRLIDTLHRHLAADLPVAETCRRVSHDLLHQRGGVTSDDATLVIVEWTGPGA